MLPPTQRVSMAEGPAPELEEGYYARNFESILDTVETRYGDLLTAEERGYVSGFFALGESAKRLYVRLVTRKGPCFRRDLLRYDEIIDLDDAAEELVAQGFFDLAEDASLADLLPLIRRPELDALFLELALIESRPALRALKRPQLVERLLAREPPELDRARRWIHGRWRVFRPLWTDVLLLFRLLFFGNLHQDLSELVISDLGIVCYESYSLCRESRLFGDRVDIDQALGLRLRRQEIESLVAADDVDSALALAREIAEVGPSWRPVIRRSVDSVLNRLGRTLERHERWSEALELYAAAQRPPARERRCRVLDRLDRAEEALDLCGEIAARPIDETERSFAPLFSHRMKRRLGLTREPWRRPKRPTQSLRVKKENRPVEASALEALAEQGREGIYSENWLWRGLFGLAFWDVIFAPVPGAFHHPFQMGPMDLSTPEFRERRQAQVAERLDALRAQADLGPLLWPVVEAKRGIANALVPWGDFVEAGLSFALPRIHGKVLAVVCDRLADHLRRFRRGLPDLFVECPASPVGFELLEVKGPGDQIRPEQGAWIDFLNRNGIPASVLKVSWL